MVEMPLKSMYDLAGKRNSRRHHAIVSVVNYIQRWAVCVATMHTA